MEKGEKSCYCCRRVPGNMEIDRALNELGMLASVTESRQQYMREQGRLQQAALAVPSPPRRMRNLSESCYVPTAVTPANSPTRSSYKVLQINPQYVISLTSNPRNKSQTVLKDVASTNDFGTKYSLENLECSSRGSRNLRSRQNRLRRFRKPYEVPWRHSLEQCYKVSNLSPDSGSKQNSSLSLPERSPRSADRLQLATLSNSSTPEKPLNQGGNFVRSKSLDELDFAKLQVAEAENHNYISERKEMDSVSQHLQNLKV